MPYHFADAVGQVPAAAVPEGEAPEADALTPSLDSAFWVWNLVSNLVYGERADVVSRALREKLLPMQARLLDGAAKTDRALSKPGLSASEVARRATEYCETTADGAFHSWRDVFLQLFALTRDGFTITKGKTPRCEAGEKEGCTARNIPNVQESGYDQAWYDRVAADGRTTVVAESGRATPLRERPFRLC